MRVIADIQRDAASMIPVERFDDDRPPEPLALGQRRLRRTNYPALRHRQTRLGEQALGQVLVAGDVDRDLSGVAGNAGSQALLPATRA